MERLQFFCNGLIRNAQWQRIASRWDCPSLNAEQYIILPRPADVLGNRVSKVDDINLALHRFQPTRLPGMPETINNPLALALHKHGS